MRSTAALLVLGSFVVIACSSSPDAGEAEHPSTDATATAAAAMTIEVVEVEPAPGMRDDAEASQTAASPKDPLESKAIPSTSAEPPASGTSGDALGADVIRTVVKRNVSRVRYCYESALLKTPGLAGKVTTKFTVAQDGRVGSVTTTGALPEPVMECISKVVRGMSFPTHTGSPVKVSYPFVFQPAG